MASKFLPPSSTQLLRNLRFFATSSSSSSAISSIPSLNLTDKPIQSPPSPPSVDTNLSSFSSSSYALDLNDTPLSSTASSAISALNLNTHRVNNNYSADCILDLNDHRKLFSTLPTKKLIHASFILQLAAMDPVVDLGIWIMKSKLMRESDGVIRHAILRMIRHTFYEHFVAGETPNEVKSYVQRVNESGLRGMLDFAVEFSTKNDGCDLNFLAFLDTIEAAKSYSPSSVSFVVAKVTAICPLKLLERVSDLLRWEERNPSFNLPWKLDTLPVFSDSSPLYHTLKKPEPLTQEEELELQLAQLRLQKLCEKCIEANVPLVVDAEHTAVQPAIDYLTYSSAILYNKDDNPIIYNTIQTYLKDAKDRVLLATKAADKMGIPMGFKLVRGAYMSMERKLASSLGYESPIHNTIQDTHACFNDCASFLLEKMADGPTGLVLATHNVESGRLAAVKARELRIGDNGNEKLEFAQLYGMADALSFSLRDAGFQVSKYMPFGPLDMVIPYLLRRAEENRGLLSASSLDRQLLRKELGRRMKDSIF
ncbi:Proline dehydrogenase 1 mitochondrial [Euphorbia peplus]|nr:Proline dehydrogenase 1 mitochondrial [Euphorbia peplus]